MPPAAPGPTGPDPTPPTSGGGQPEWPDVSKASRGYWRPILGTTLVGVAGLALAATTLVTADRSATTTPHSPQAAHTPAATIAPVSPRSKPPATRPPAVRVQVAARLPEGCTTQTVVLYLRGVQAAVVRTSTTAPAATRPVTVQSGQYTYTVDGAASCAGGTLPIVGSGTVDLTRAGTAAVETRVEGGRISAAVRVA